MAWETPTWSRTGRSTSCMRSSIIRGGPPSAVCPGYAVEMNLRGLQHVSSPVPQGRQAEVRRFYGELLGLTEVPVPRTLDASQLVWYAAGDGMELHFFP